MGGDDSDDSDDTNNPLGLPESMLQSTIGMAHEPKGRFQNAMKAENVQNPNDNMTRNHSIESPTYTNNVRLNSLTSA